MDMTEKNGQPSMEEILASIRRIVAEEPETQMPHAPASAPVIDFRSNPITLNGDGVLDDTSEFDLPAIFRASAAPQPEKPGPFGRLTDAIRNATSGAQPEPKQAQAIDDSSDHSSDASGTRFGGQSESYQALSSLKPARPEPPAAEAAKETKPASQGWSFNRSSPPPPAINEEIKRVMAPFKDTHFLRMSGPSPTPEILEPLPAPAAASAPATPLVVVEDHKQAPIPAPAPAAEPARAVDFGAIVPGHFERPGATSRPDAVTEREAASQPAPRHDGVSPTPPPLTVVSSGHSADAAGLTPPSLPEGQGSGTIEDATAELLRPMLRQWLADNMPRMVEKALHIEVAESVKSVKKPTGL